MSLGKLSNKANNKGLLSQNNKFFKGFKICVKKYTTRNERQSVLLHSWPKHQIQVEAINFKVVSCAYLKYKIKHFKVSKVSRLTSH